MSDEQHRSWLYLRIEEGGGMRLLGVDPHAAAVLVALAELGAGRGLGWSGSIRQLAGEMRRAGYPIGRRRLRRTLHAMVLARVLDVVQRGRSKYCLFTLHCVSSGATEHHYDLSTGATQHHHLNSTGATEHHIGATEHHIGATEHHSHGSRSERGDVLRHHPLSLCQGETAADGGSALGATPPAALAGEGAADGAEEPRRTGVPEQHQDLVDSLRRRLALGGPEGPNTSAELEERREELRRQIELLDTPEVKRAAKRVARRRRGSR